MLLLSFVLGITLIDTNRTFSVWATVASGGKIFRNLIQQWQKIASGEIIIGIILNAFVLSLSLSRTLIKVTESGTIYHQFVYCFLLPFWPRNTLVINSQAINQPRTAVNRHTCRHTIYLDTHVRWLR